jgi:hypothetical protein
MAARDECGDGGQFVAERQSQDEHESSESAALVVLVELREGAPEAHGPHWRDAEYAERDAVLAALGIAPFRRKRA